MKFILIGDPTAHSDIGLFCLRVENRKHNGFRRQFYYIDSTTSRKVEPSRELRNTRLVLNIGNNIYLISNLLKALRFTSSIDTRKHDDIYAAIIHDVNLEYAFDLLCDSIKKNVIHNDLLKISNITIDEIKEVFNWIIPIKLHSFFLNFPREGRGYLLLAFLLKKFKNIIIHSLYAQQIAASIADSLSIVCRFERISLAYDMPPMSFSESKIHDSRTAAIRIAFFSLAFNTTKNFQLLKDTLLEISKSRSVILDIFGKTDSRMVRQLVFSLRSNGIDTRDHGFAEPEELFLHVGQADYSWVYRDPTHGESSGTVLRSLSLGTCPIVADHGWYSELPNELVLKVPLSTDPRELCRLIINHNTGNYSWRSKRVDYLKKSHSPENYAFQLSCFISKNINVNCTETSLDFLVDHEYKPPIDLNKYKELTCLVFSSQFHLEMLAPVVDSDFHPDTNSSGV